MKGVEQKRARHSSLVDKKFLEGLTGAEALELTDINHCLDAAEEKYYAPIKKILAEAIEKMQTKLTVKEFLVKKARNRTTMDEIEASEYVDIFLDANSTYQGRYYLDSYPYPLQSQLNHQFSDFLNLANGNNDT